MPTDVTAASRHEHLALYDPAAIPPDLPVDPDLDAQDPNPLPASAIREVTSRGEALILHIPTEDCEATLRVFVDEDPPQPIAGRGAVVVSGARLKVPSGTLKADGLEFMTRSGEVRKHSEAENVAVPPGDYEVEVRELMSWKIRHRQSSTRSGATPREKVAHRLVTVYTWIGIVLIPGNVLIAPIIVGGLWQARGWRSGLAAASLILVIDAIVLGGFWLLDSAQKRFPALSRIQQSDAAFDQDNPDIVVVLRRRTGAASTSTSAFGQILLK
jgi:hypothetical protein